MPTKHDETAKRIAAMKGVRYNQGQGPDIITSRETIEVETVATIADAARQLQGYRGPVYVAGADAEATKAALKRYKDTMIGVMDPFGKILKSSVRDPLGDLLKSSVRDPLSDLLKKSSVRNPLSNLLKKSSVRNPLGDLLRNSTRKK